MNKFSLPMAKLNFESDYGFISICANADGITHLNFIPQTDDEWLSREIDSQVLQQNKLNTATEQQQAHTHLLQAKQQLLEYFDGKRQYFDVALAPKGTEFQQQVWQALTEIDFGQSCSYGDIANKVNRPKAVRAVGTANGANPIAILVPCHRVIGKNGTLTGYAYGLALKQKLLKLEGL
ncbi:methylated-DNA--[protein]-cysteine S-methyltransferase [Shewanella sairae]|nr:methylated-DNA--[protein]-cysteine S-methyltransferase [Shewanella sairae]MCL1130326.1 methylated-DNA--[protein]-cysteine S-methyltransferase [Shewanella sairae]